MSQHKLVLGAVYHTHCQGIEDCVEGVAVALSRDWVVIEQLDGSEQALPIPLLEVCNKFPGTVQDWRELRTEVQAEAEQQADPTQEDRLAAMQTLFPGMPDETAKLIAGLLDESSSPQLAQVLAFSRPKH